MSEPETRILVRKKRISLGTAIDVAVVRQQAIPWCSIHNLPADPEWKDPKGRWMCAYEWVVHGTECNVSTGGPHHLWWRDE